MKVIQVYNQPMLSGNVLIRCYQHERTTAIAQPSKHGREWKQSIYINHQEIQAHVKTETA
jgi:hypothetical protein